MNTETGLFYFVGGVSVGILVTQFAPGGWVGHLLLAMVATICLVVGVREVRRIR